MGEFWNECFEKKKRKEFLEEILTWPFDIQRFTAEKVADKYRQKLDEQIMGINVDDNC